MLLLELFLSLSMYILWKFKPLTAIWLADSNSQHYLFLITQISNIKSSNHSSSTQQDSTDYKCKYLQYLCYLKYSRENCCKFIIGFFNAFKHVYIVLLTSLLMPINLQGLED